MPMVGTQLESQGMPWEHQQGQSTAKVWKFQVRFTTKIGTYKALYGTITATGAGSVENPLEKYDVNVVLG